MRLGSGSAHQSGVKSCLISSFFQESLYSHKQVAKKKKITCQANLEVEFGAVE